MNPIVMKTQLPHLELTHEPSAPSKELSSLVADANSGIHTTPLELIGDGDGGAYFVRDTGNKRIGVFKPTGEDPQGMKNPKAGEKTTNKRRSIPPGTCSIREVAAYALDTTGFAGIPLTTEVRVNTGTETKTGSLQKFETHDCASWDIAPGYFSVEDVHRIGIFDLRSCNTDRHGGNMLARKVEGKEQYRLIPIDHAYCFPSALGELNVEWMWWDQARKPFSAEHLTYIANINVESDLELLASVGLDEESLIVNKAMTLTLKIGASKGKTLYQIARMCKRRGKRKSDIETVMEKVEANINRKAGTDDQEFWSAFTKEIHSM